jgi:hypothetical protein
MVIRINKYTWHIVDKLKLKWNLKGGGSDCLNLDSCGSGWEPLPAICEHH